VGPAGRRARPGRLRGLTATDGPQGGEAGATGGQAGQPRFPPPRAAGRGPGWYRGDCHLHSARSHGGQLTPGELAAAARASGLDFIAITEHNTADTHGAFGPLAGHSWIAGSPSVGLSLEARAGERGAGIGERLDTRGRPALVRVEVRHPGGQMAALTNPVILS